MKKIAIPLLLALSALTGCSSPHTLYHWGNYEEQIYSNYSEPGKLTPEQQLTDLENDAQLIQANKSAAPPGFHAQLGYLYFQTGKTDLALQAFETEKKLYPESSVYMNRLIARLSH